MLGGYAARRRKATAPHPTGPDVTAQLPILLAQLHESPGDDVLWLAVADCLEEHGEPLRAELLRLSRRLRDVPEGPASLTAEKRVRKLIADGVTPCVPEVVNSLGMRFALIPPGSFWMGSAEGEKWHRPSERPRHLVEITRPFWMGVFPVTQREYRRVTRNNPSHFSATAGGLATLAGADPDGFPVERVSWNDAADYCPRLSGRAAERKAGRVYRLPTEAEWEYCCRAGLASPGYHFGPSLSKKQANIRAAGHERPCAVGSYPPNAWGLFDMHGQVWEWCADWYDAAGYGPAARQRDPQGPARGRERILRGGCWNNDADFCRTAHRGASHPATRNAAYGFRVCFTVG
jgi:uncharacterized protein (TIGR02996 family)